MLTSRRAEWTIVLTTLFAAIGWFFSKQAIQELPPFGFIGIRFILASLCLLPFCLKALKKASWRDCLESMSVGLLLAGAILCWVNAVSMSDTLGEGAFIMSLSMLFAPLLAWPLFGIRPTNAFWISLPIAIIGLFLLSWNGDWVVAANQLWFIAAAFGLALHFNFNRQFSAKLPTMLLTTLQIFTVGCLGITLSLFTESWPAVAMISTTTWYWLILSVLLATSLRYLIQTIGQKHANPTNAAILMLLEPIWTLTLSVLLYNEALPMNKMIGCSLVLFALLFYRVLPIYIKSR